MTIHMSTVISTRTSIQMCVQHFCLSILGVDSLHDLGVWFKNSTQDATNLSRVSPCEATTEPHIVPAARRHSEAASNVR